MFRTYGELIITGYRAPTQVISVNNQKELNYETYDAYDNYLDDDFKIPYGVLPKADLFAIYNEFDIIDDQAYAIELLKFEPGIGNYIFWISTADEQHMYAQKLTKDTTTFRVKFVNSKFTKIRAGILFYKPYRGDFFRIRDITLMPSTAAAAVDDLTVIDGHVSRYNIETEFDYGAEGAEPVMTVAVPVYNAADIIWLALDSLVAQTDITFQWELIIFEEGGGSAALINKYRASLEENGCVRILYKTIRNKISLINKWLEMAASASPSSRIFVLQSADDYSPPTRLATHQRHFEDASCILSTQRHGLFYNLQTHEKMFYVGKNLKKSHKNNAYRLEHFRRIPVCHNMGEHDTNSYIHKSIEDAVHSNGGTDVDMRILFADGDDWKRGFFTDGSNPERERTKYYGASGPAKLFYPYSYNEHLGYASCAEYLPAKYFGGLAPLLQAE